MAAAYNDDTHLNDIVNSLLQCSMHNCIDCIPKKFIYSA